MLKRNKLPKIESRRVQLARGIQNCRKEKKKLETAKICNSNIKKSLGSVNTFENAKNELLTKI